jgi:hypothetical protein
VGGNSNTANNVAGSAAGSASKTGSSGLSSYLLPAGLGLAAINALIPGGSNPVNTSNLSNAQNSFNSALPKYNFNSVQTPYTGNWYTYGQRPETPMVSNTITPAARGGLMKGYASGGQVSHPVPLHKPIMPPLKDLSVQDVANALPKGIGLAANQQATLPASTTSQPSARPYQPTLSDMQSQDGNFYDYARGGRVRALAMGGMPMQAPMGAPPMANPQGPPQMAPQMPPQGAPKAANPLQQAAQFQLGQKIGQALRKHIKGQGMTPDGRVMGPGKGQDDAIPAKLSQGEYVIPSEVVAQLGDGSSNAGGKVLDKMVSHVRHHKTSHGKHFPPKAKNPLAYIHEAHR